MKQLLQKIVRDPLLHAKWLNTLSYLENCGARKIAACEHPIHVPEEMLKHASEEFRHAHYLKKQIEKCGHHLPDYSLSTLLGGHATLRYLDRIELFTSRLFKSSSPLIYLLVTYAIEVRARSLYPLYEQVLREERTPIYVKSIILEEEGHLAEMERALKSTESGLPLAQSVLSYERTLFTAWKNQLTNSL